MKHDSHALAVQTLRRSARRSDPLARHAAAPAEILIYGDIGLPGDESTVTATSIAQQLRQFDGTSTISVRINSAGGSVFEGLTIYQQFIRHPANIHVTVDGLAASIASVIAMAGDTIEIGHGARMMIHDAWTLAWGNAQEMRRIAALLDDMSTDLAEIYAHRSGLSADTVRAYMTEETWFSAAEAVDAGLADAKTAGPRAQARATSSILGRFRKVPEGLLEEAGLVDAAARVLVSVAAYDATRD